MTSSSSSAALQPREADSEFLQSLQLSTVPALVRIDWPSPGMSLIDDRLSIRGRIALRPQALEQMPEGPPSLELLLEPMEPLGSFAAGLRIVAEQHAVHPDTPGIESFEIQPIDFSVFGEGEFNEEVLGYEFQATVNLSGFVPQDGGESRVVWLSFATRLGSYLAVSNALPANILPSVKRSEPLGGFFSPQQSMHYADYLDICGWAFRKNDQLEQVQVSINDVPQSGVRIGIPSGHVASLFPGIEEAKQARFLLCLKRETVLQSGLSEAALSSQFVITAQCRFVSGAELSLRSSAVTWRPAPLCFNTKEFASIETVQRAGSDGGLTIEGWIVSSAAATPRLFLQGLQQKLEFGVDPYTALEWIQREDVEKMLPTIVQQRPWGFRATFQPSELGRYLGVPRIMAQLEPKTSLVPVGSQSSWQQISEQASHFRPKSGPLARAANTVARCATRLGVHQPIPIEQGSSGVEQLRAPGPRRILLCSHNLFGTEGAPKVLLEIARAVKTVFQPQAEIMVLAGREGSLRQAYEEIGVRVEVVPKLAVSAPYWGDFRQCFSYGFAKAVEFAPDMVYANCSGCFWGVQIAERLGLPSVWCVHESVPPEQWCADLDTRYRMGFLNSLSRCNLIVFVAESTKDLYSHAVSAENMRTIPNGIDIEAFAERRAAIDVAVTRAELGVASDEIMISIIGTTTERKGQDIFLREMAALERLMPAQGFRFFVVGARRSTFLEKIRRMAADLAIEDRVTFVDEQPEVAKYFVASDIIAMCSLEESAPLVSLEAFAYGVPLVSTRVFGLAEQLEDEANALCFAVTEEGGLARCVKRLLEDSALADRLVQGGYQSLQERFSLQQSTKHHWQEICQVFARHRAMSC